MPNLKVLEKDGNTCHVYRMGLVLLNQNPSLTFPSMANPHVSLNVNLVNVV